jgi:hypothetical protein
MLVKYYFQVHLRGCFQKRLTFELVDKVKKIHPHQFGLASFDLLGLKLNICHEALSFV